MFGLRLKSWMEAHLGRPRHKSTTHQNQKNHRGAPKDSSSASSGGGSSSSGTTATNNTTTTVTTSISAPLSSSNSYPLDSYVHLQEQNSNLDSSPSSEFSSTTSPTTDSNVQAQTTGSVDTVTAQHQKQQQQQRDLAEPCAKDRNNEEKLNESHNHQPTTCTRSSTGSVSNSTSNSILLGSFSNNLSSPDTGYSTDGYSPKSVYPALSFESSGKSTPKSSYTISSLVSSELLQSSSKHTTTSLISSASCSVELDHECVSSLLTTSPLPSHPENTEKPNNGGNSNSSIDRGRGNNNDKSNPKGDSSTGQQHKPSFNSHSIKHETEPLLSPAVTFTPSSSQDLSRGNDTVSSKQQQQCNSPLSHVTECSSSHSNCENMVAPQTKTTLNNNFSSSSSQSHSESNGTCKHFSGISNHGLSSVLAENNNLLRNHQHRRTESMDERKSIKVSDTEGSNSSSMLTGVGNRNIRTSFVLVTPTTASQIPECNLALKNTFSICSPRRERTRIKTNPWITLSQHNNDENSNANSRINNTEVNGISEPFTRKPSPQTTKENTCMEKVVAFRQQQGYNNNSNGLSPSQINASSAVCGKTNTVLEINNKSPITDGESDGGGESSRRGDAPLHLGESLSLVYRISTSTSASDSGLGSGKGSLDPGTNRNSTESSCLLSDSASTRNSIISHEAEPSCSESRSRSSSNSATPDTFSNGHAAATFFTSKDAAEHSKTQQHHHHHLDFSSEPVNEVSSAKSTPICMSKSHGGAKDTSILLSPLPLQQNNSNYISEPKSEIDISKTESITLPPGLISSNSASVSAQTNVIMVDKETDILSDWANTDEDGEDEIETDGNDNEEGVTPTPSSPDTDTGGRAIFPNSQSTSASSATDIDFGDSSAATAASSTGICPSSTAYQHHRFQNINKHGANGSSLVPPLSQYHHHHHHNIMNLPTTCYQPIQIVPITQQGGIHLDINLEERAYWNHQSEPLVNHVLLQQQQPTDIVGLQFNNGDRCPNVLGIPNANISLSSLYSNSLESPSDYNANKGAANSSSHALARGALGFLRKIFKKGSCSSHRTSPGSDRIKVPRSGKLKDNNSHLDNIPSVTGLRSPLLTADALVSHQLAGGGGRKSSLNGYFLTPTPNAFRRRSGTGTDSSDSKSSKHHNKSVKTDIIRLPPGALSPNQQGHNNNIQNSSSSTTSSSQHTTSVGAFCISSLQNNTPFGTGTNTLGYSNTNTNSTTASSAHSMSTSVSAASAAGMSTVGVSQNVNSKTPIPNQSRLNDNFYSNSNPNRQSPFMSSPHQHHHQQNPTGYIMPPIFNPIGTHSTKPQLPPPLPPVPAPTLLSSMPSPYLQNTSADINCQSQTVHHHHHQQQRDFPSAHPSTTRACPYESPRLQNPPTHRINSPSFNNYSPIHRLVVTGGNHLLSRGPPTNPSSHHPPHLSQNQQQCASSYNTESPRLTSRNGNSPLPPHSHNNNNSSTTFTPINRLGHPTSSPSPLINHLQSISSPHPHSSSSGHPHSGSHTFASPSPILRNSRYQYIASSNQNSPVLNVPKRIHLPSPQMQQQQHHYYHHNNQGHGVIFPQPLNPNGPPSSSTFSPTPPPRQNANHNPFSTASPNLNHQQHNSPSNARPHRSGSLHTEFENANTPNLQVQGITTGNTPTSSSSRGANNIISRSQSYQPHQIHYYASPVIPQPPIPLQSQQRVQTLHPSGFSLNEPPLLMKTHLHNQNIRLNNFLMNKQRHSQSQNNCATRFPNSESFQERIYETVDSEDDNSEENGREEDKITGISIHDMPLHNQDNRYSPSNVQRRNNVTSKSEFHNSHINSNTGILTSSKSKRSKPPRSESESVCQPQQQQQQQQQRPPVPMALFGPNTFLSETETRLLDKDREADRKYKRLINEAEALLREISAVKSQQPWAHRDNQDRFRFEECPQSDPLKRKAYDCWALRRLQQELAGCCASPPVLHRSRMNLQSPSTPTGSTGHPYITPNLSLVQNCLQEINPPLMDNNRNNGNF